MMEPSDAWEQNVKCESHHKLFPVENTFENTRKI